MPGNNVPSSSFIPKTPTTGVVKPQGVRRIYIITYVITVVFLGTLIAAGATFFYDLRSDNRLAAVRMELDAERASFAQGDLLRIKHLEQRLNATRSLLDSHVSLVRVFEALERSTIGPVRLTGLSFERLLGQPVTLSASAQTADVNAALFQRQVYADDATLQGLGLSRVTVEAMEDDAVSGRTQVRFTLSGNFGRNEIGYQPGMMPNEATDSFPMDEMDEVFEVDGEGDIFDLGRVEDDLNSGFDNLEEGFSEI